MQNRACRSRLKFSSSCAWFPKNGHQRSLYLYTMLGGFFRMGRNLPLWPTGKIIGKTCPFQEIPVTRKGRGQTRRGYYGKLFEKVGWILYSLHQLCLLTHNALRFIIAKFRAGELHSCLHHSSDRPCSLGGRFWPFKLEITSSLRLHNCNWQICKIELAESSLQIWA